MNMTAANARVTVDVCEEDAEAKTLAWLASLPVGKPATRKEAARLAEHEANLTAGIRGRSHNEVMADARARFR